MTLPYPIPKQLRQTDIFVGNGGTVYSGFNFKIFDIGDVEVWTMAATDAAFVQQTSVTVAKLANLPFDDFSVTFPANQPATTQILVRSARLDQRSAGVMKGTQIDPTAVEKEFSKISTEMQELRRDVDRSLRPDFGADTILPIPRPDPGKPIVWRQDGRGWTNGAETYDGLRGRVSQEVLDRIAGDLALASLIGQAGPIETAIFDTRVAVSLARVKGTINAIRTAGYSVVGIGGALYKRVVAEPSHIGKVQSLDGAWWEIVPENGMLSASQLGGGQAAVEAANSLVDIVRIDQAVSITATSTWPKGKIYRFSNGAGLVIADGVTLTITGAIDAPAMRGIPGVGPNQIFSVLGTGKVIGIAQVCAEWWGAKGDYTIADDQPALQAAHDCVENSWGSDCLGRPTIRLRAGAQYGIDSTWVLRPKHIVNLCVEGGGSVLGTRIWVRSTFSSTIGILVDGQTDGSAAIADFLIKDFSLYKVSGSAAIAGIQVGNAGKSLIGYKTSSFENVHVNGFIWNWNVTGLMTRLIKWDRCDGWSDTLSGGIGVRIKDGGAGSFVGDLVFDTCQCVVPEDSGSSVLIQSSTSGAQIKGLRFPNCTNYKGNEYFSIQASAGGLVGDIWLPPGVQFDGFGRTMLRINASGSGTAVDDIHVDHVYFRGINSGYYAIYATSDGVATLSNLFITNNWIANVTGRAVYITNAAAVTYQGNQHRDVLGGPNDVVRFTACTGVACTGNTLNRTGENYAQYFITFETSDHYSAVGNIAGGCATTGVIQEITAGSNKALTANVA